MPAAIDSPAEPVVCTMLFSRMVDLPSVRKKATASTAIGNRGRDREADLERQVDARGGEDDAQDRAEDHRAEGQLGGRLASAGRTA